ncbi:hypothetical protein [Candidatus Aalborgicola defluviihabitans]|uniref:hypothetical protein n=1 Tax=Candidatus Aalborgicola defluviihabitans TaxID=3386187 RepID=UPI001ECD3D1E|nr:hypothetical protein [Burkholderiales bacterium]
MKPALWQWQRAPDQPIGLVMLSPDGIARSGSAHEKAALTQSLAEHLTNVNAQLEPHERLDCLAVISHHLDARERLCDTHAQVKRARIEEAYGGQYEAWLAQRQPVVWRRGLAHTINSIVDYVYFTRASAIFFM